MGGLPTGVVTFLLTDVAGSTRLWEADPTTMRAAMARHDALVEREVRATGGRVVKPRGEGDSTFSVFSSPHDALQAALEINLALHAESWPTDVPLTVRAALATGEADLRTDDYYGGVVNRCARMRSVGHPRQVLVAESTARAAAGSLRGALGLTDLGLHRLKDLSGPERIYQLTHPELPDEFPALLTPDRTRHNLPVQLSSFVGRQEDVMTVRDLLGRNRLVTVTGFGGMGKTRLALQVGAELADGDGDGVWFVDLSSLRDPASLPDAVASALDLVVGNYPLRAIADYLVDKKLLLILDNLEQLLPEAAAMVAALATAGAGVRVLVTSREAVGIRGEHVFPLPPLGRPDQGAFHTAESLGSFEAAQLFVDRAIAFDPRFVVDDETAPVVAEICHQLDGWPLALELAAARTRQMSLHALRDHLSDHLGVLTGGPRDVPDRQRTLRETIAWSYDLLSGPEQQLLAKLSVFRGGVSLPAAEAVCRGGGMLPVLDGLASLLDKSLLRMDEQGRFQLLETVREFAAERLDASGEAAAVRTRHAHYYLGLYPEHVAGAPATEAFGTEIANVVAALEWLVETEPEQAARLFTAVQYRLVTHLHATSAAQWGDRLDRLELTAEARARLDVCRGTREIASGDREAAVVTLSQAARTLLEAKDQAYALRACVNLAGTLPEMGRTAEAAEWAERAREVSSWSDPPLFRATTLAVVALGARLSGDFARCIEICQEATSEEQPGDSAGLIDAWDELSRAYSALGRLDEAVRAARECLALARREGGPQMELYPFSSLGRALVMRGDFDEGAAHLVASLRIARLSGLLPFDLGWVAVALQSTAPESGALALGAHERMLELNSDPDQDVPAVQLDPVRSRYLADHPQAVDEGRRLGWPAVGVLLDELELPLVE